MTRRDAHFDAMLRHLGATYYQTLQGTATPSDVARALDTLAAEAARHQPGAGHPAGERGHGRQPRSGRWRVRDVMTSEVVSVDKRAPGTLIARLMSEHHVNALPVVTGGRRVAGVVSEADLLMTQHRRSRGMATRLLGRRSRPGGADAYTAGQLMTTPAITIHPDAPLGAAARRMTDHNLTLLPVVDTAGELIGVISRRDLLKVFLRSDTDIAAEVGDVLSDVLLIDPATVAVSAHEGMVTLTGEIEQPDLAPVAVRLAESVDGVLAVVDKLTTAAAPAPHPGS